MERFYVRDTRQVSVVHGKPEGAWLKVPPFPMLQWVKSQEKAELFTAEEIDFLKKCDPYLAGCEVVPAQAGKSRGSDVR